MKKSKELDMYGPCPECGKSWKGEPINPDIKEELTSHPYYASLLIGIEYVIIDPNHYDGISEWMCPFCKARFNRWTNELLKPDEAVAPYGKIVKIKKEK